MKSTTLITTIVLTIIALAHLVRLFLQLDATVGSLVVPAWTSLPAALFMGGLAFLLWRENRKN